MINNMMLIFYILTLFAAVSFGWSDVDPLTCFNISRSRKNGNRIKTPPTLKPRSRAVSSFFRFDSKKTTTRCNMVFTNGEPLGGQHFTNAGESLKSAAKSIGSQYYACPHLLSDAGDAFMEVGEAWATSWEAVTYAADDAASVFFALSQLEIDSGLQTCFRGVSGDLKEISNIHGCLSVGPPSAVPNLEAISQHLKSAADVVKKLGGELDKDCCFSKPLRDASISIGAMANEY